ncbi:hypothetical protein [Antarcticimicrobium sediminis]|uniref:Uncharacterized protein n=1 Tax=Antarcticimicrobium sediminis TaxID=2546227 RepID=A0A4V2Z7V8_9RHOB|nr:hypothetical protein [Antarcticimicrobium sediminis]TDE37976.1 hypothetical protein E1B25_11165 [Antarcticimicrobium sediminis]
MKQRSVEVRFSVISSVRHGEITNKWGNMRVSQAAFLAILISGLYLFVFVVMFWGLMPVQAAVAGKYFAFAQVISLVALTHGVRVVATWLFRWKAIFFLAPGVAAQVLILGRYFALSPEELTLMFFSFTTSSFFAFETFRALGVCVYSKAASRSDWRALMGVGMLATFINTAFLTQIDLGFANPNFSVWFGLNLIIGGVLGLFVCLLLLRVALRRFVGAPDLFRRNSPLRS